MNRETREKPLVGARPPWGFLLAVVMLIGVELVVRAAGPGRMLPYHLGRQEYQATHDFLHTFGPADVCFVGSSRSREAVYMPLVRQRLEAELRRPVTVANYAIGGARAEEALTIIDKMLASPTKPRMIFYGIEARQILVDETRHIVSARMWALDEWFDNYRTYGLSMFEHMPEAMRNEIGRHYKTFQSRKLVENLIDQRITGWTHTCPLRGEPTPYHRNTPDRSLVTEPISEAHAAQYVQNAIDLGELVGEGKSAQTLETIISKCNRAGVTLVLFESPTSPLLDRHTPAGVRERFRRIVGEIAESHGIAFVTEDDLKLALDDTHWLEQSHLNVHGARRFTDALVTTAVLPTTRTVYHMPQTAGRDTLAMQGR